VGVGLVGGAVVLGAMVALAVPSAGVADESTDYGKVLATLSREIPQQMKAAHVVGLSIALVDGDRTVWARGFGWADRAGREPVTRDTLFRIGSVSKTMTATAVMQLVEQGRVNLDAPLVALRTRLLFAAAVSAVDDHGAQRAGHALGDPG
jgi:CubicO group peptidase (beta-lactamase class C family)